MKQLQMHAAETQRNGGTRLDVSAGLQLTVQEIQMCFPQREQLGLLSYRIFNKMQSNKGNQRKARRGEGKMYLRHSEERIT